MAAHRRWPLSVTKSRKLPFLRAVHVTELVEFSLPFGLPWTPRHLLACIARAPSLLTSYLMHRLQVACVSVVTEGCFVLVLFAVGCISARTAFITTPFFGRLVPSDL